MKQKGIRKNPLYGWKNHREDLLFSESVSMLTGMLYPPHDLNLILDDCDTVNVLELTAYVPTEALSYAAHFCERTR